MERAFSLSVSVPTPFRIPHRVLALIGVITFILACCLAGCTSNAADSDSSATDGNATGEKTLRVAMELAPRGWPSTSSATSELPTATTCR